MPDRSTTKTQTSEKLKKQHDRKASIRFLENLYNEIAVANKIEDVKDPHILKKFNEVILFLKKELS